jgi:diguanylate cyclase (GGDEF)-like protein
LSLRARLTLFFVVIVVLPLAAISLFVRASFDRSLLDQSRRELRADQRAAVGILRVRSAEAAQVARLLASDRSLQRGLETNDVERLRKVAELRALEGFTVAVTDRGGRLLAQAGEPPSFLPGFTPPALGEVLAAGPKDPRRALFVREYVDVSRPACTSNCVLGRIVAGFWADDNELVRMRGNAVGEDLTFTVAGRAVASTRPGLSATSLPVPAGDGLTTVRLAGRSDHALGAAWLDGFGQDQVALVISKPVESTAAPLRRLGWALALLGLLVAAVVSALGFLLARTVSQPLRDLAEQTRPIASGDFGRAPPHTTAGGEVGQLARSFDTMRQELGEHVSALRASRDELTRSMARVGETLVSTSDLPKLLTVVLEAAVQARQARAGSLLLFDDERITLVPEATFGLGKREATRVRAGDGVIGTVAVSGRAVVVPGPADAPEPAFGEPKAATQVSVPLRSRGQVIGVLSVYDREAGGPFTDADAQALAAFAGQAAVGIENVRLHEEARRLSVTDEMTGIWNFRYFRLRIEQEIERARRFRREVSLLLVDVDHFKDANDRYGHPQGDQILRELARRVGASIRDVDTFARYGGEEFVLILPETDTHGAKAAAEKIRLAIAARPFEGIADTTPIRVTVSLGVACYPRHAQSATALIQAADAAMYRAKTSGRDRVVVAEAVAGAGLYPDHPSR